MMDGIGKVIQRMSSLEQRFGTGAAGTDFSAHLSAAIGQQTTNSTQNPAATGGDVLTMLKGAAVRYGVDPKLAIAVAQTESGLSPEAISPTGAVGVMQLMPETAISLGVANSHDIGQNIDGGVRYLRQLLDTFGGDIEKTLAAYNAGPQVVKGYGGVPPYQETREYVAKVKELYG